MGHDSSYVIIKDGVKNYSYNRYQGKDIVFSLLFGLDEIIHTIYCGEDYFELALIDWADQGIIVDLDERVILFWGADFFLGTSVYVPYFIDLLKTTTWKGWDVRWAKDGTYSFIKYLNLSELLVCNVPQIRIEQQKLDRFNWWQDSDLISCQFDYGDEQTIITHRNLDGEILDYLTEHDLEDTLCLGESILKILKIKQPITSLPQEIDLEDYLYIDEVNRDIHVFWGYPWFHISQSYSYGCYWQGWQIFWNDKRYQGHLALSDRYRDDLLLSSELAINRLMEMFASSFKHDWEYARDNFSNYNQNYVLQYQKKLAFLESIRNEYLNSKIANI